MTSHQWSEVLHWMGLVPLGWMVVLRSGGISRGAAWWWIACALSVSFLADSLAHAVNPWVISIVYPISQASVVAYVLLDRDDAMTLIMTMLATGMLSVALFGVDGPDTLLSSVACFAVAGIAMRDRALGRIRWSLLTYFGVGQLAWLALSAWIAHCDGVRACLAGRPGMEIGALYQATRAVGIGLFCVVSLNPAPNLRLFRTVRAYDEWHPLLRS